MLAGPTIERSVGLPNIGEPNKGAIVPASHTTDRIEIADLFARLAALLDEHRHDDAGTVYLDDAVVRSPQRELHGINELIGHLKRSRVEGEHTQHVHGDVLVSVDGDHATATANQVVYVHRTGEAPHQTSGLRTAATAQRTPAGWRFSSLHITPAWTRKD
jgi:ketosteroid isomerase-like protein